MTGYLKSTQMLNFNSKEITELIKARNWSGLNEFDKIGAIFDYVQNEILLGYNKYDTLTASQVLKDGIGQCNTKATLLMALLRAVKIPCRLHGTVITKTFQRSLMPKIMAKIAPPRIVHTWAEVFYEGSWVSLEGVITDKKYITGLQSLFPEHKGKFFDYAVAVKDFSNLQIDWNGTDTTIQKEAVIEDFGVFYTPDEFFFNHPQTIKGVKKFLYEKIGRKIMTSTAAKIRRLTV